MKKSKKTYHHFYSENDIKKEYKFWDTQLVPKFNQDSSLKFGPIKSEFKKEDIIQLFIIISTFSKWFWY